MIGKSHQKSEQRNSKHQLDLIYRRYFIEGNIHDGSLSPCPYVTIMAETPD